MNQALTTYGSYEIDDNVCEMYVHKSEEISQDSIKATCHEIIKNAIHSLTLELENNAFIYFHRHEYSILFIEGDLSEYIDLKNIAKKNPEKSFSEQAKSSGQFKEISLKEQRLQDTSAEKNLDENSNASNIHQSLFQCLDSFKKSYTNTELYFRPFSAPGGDFYWIKEYQYKSLCIVGDCTGHGMEGAMIAMSAMTLLKQFFRLPPTDIKESVHEYHKLFKSLMEDEQRREFDVEIGAVLLDKRTNKIQYMGSGINMIVKKESACEQYASRKAKLISGKQDSYEVKLEMGDQIFLFSDGITDQFDSLDRKKLGAKNLLQMIETLSFPASKDDFLTSFNQFKGQTLPLDDQTALMLTL